MYSLKSVPVPVRYNPFGDVLSNQNTRYTCIFTLCTALYKINQRLYRKSMQKMCYIQRENICYPMQECAIECNKPDIQQEKRVVWRA